MTSVVGYQSDKMQARNYVSSLLERGHVNVQLFRYITALNGYSEGDKRYREGYGYAVRYTSGPVDDHLRSPKTGERFHDKSITLFCGSEGIPVDQLFPRNGIIASIPGEAVTPYWVAARSPMPDSPLYVHPESVILKRYTAHDANDYYPWHYGPAKYFHVLMKPEEVS